MRRDARPAVAGTRGEILTLLCGGSRTVSELAEALGISRNAVREHLGRLADEELVGWVAVRRGVGKPAHEYSLTPDGERVLSRAYLPFLLHLLDRLEGHLDPPALAALLREAGRGLAVGKASANGSLRARAESAVAVLGEMGGAGRVEERGGSLWIVSSCCPVAAVVARHPTACAAVEALVAELTGAPVREECEHTGTPRCRLRVAAPMG